MVNICIVFYRPLLHSHTGMKLQVIGKGGETPGTTTGQSTEVWGATPGHATPGHVTPGRETPSHDKGASSRRNRSDETPKTERGKVL